MQIQIYAFKCSDEMENVKKARQIEISVEKLITNAKHENAIFASVVTCLCHSNRSRSSWRSSSSFLKRLDLVPLDYIFS